MLKIKRTIRPGVALSYNDWHRYLNEEVMKAKGFQKSEKAILKTNTNK